MKTKLLAVIFVLSSCATYAQTLRYIKAERVSSPTDVTFSNIEEYLKTINEFGIKTVFITDKLFIAQHDGANYTIARKGYETLADFQSGNSVFRDGESFYIAKEAGFKTQEETDYFRREAYLSVDDYKDAQKLGFVRNITVQNESYWTRGRNSYESDNTISGIISGAKMQENIKYGSMAVFLDFYYTWTRKGETVTASFRERAASQRNNSSLIDNTLISNIISVSNDSIRKLNNFDYYIINIPLNYVRDSFLYYLCKFLLFDNYADYEKNIKTAKVTKDTDNILKQLGFNSRGELVAADNAGFNNSADYYLAQKYNIDKNTLEKERAYIAELEKIKTEYDLDKVYASGNSAYYAAMIHFVKKLPVGIPFSFQAFTRKYQNDNANSAVAQVYSPSSANFLQMCKSLPQLEKLLMYNADGDSLYLRKTQTADPPWSLN